MTTPLPLFAGATLLRRMGVSPEAAPIQSDSITAARPEASRSPS
jgi:hypothetical protein